MKFRVQPGVGVHQERVVGSTVVQDWLSKLGPESEDASALITAVQEWGGQVQLVVLRITQPDNEVSTAILMYGAVDVPVVLRPLGTKGQQDYALLVSQVRPAVGGRVLSNPSGRLKPTEDPRDASSREVFEETTLKVDPTWFISLNDKVTGSDEPYYVSPGMITEEVRFYAVVIVLPLETIQSLDGQTAGLAEEDEETHLMVVPVRQVLRRLRDYGKADLKTVTAWLSYLAWIHGLLED